MNTVSEIELSRKNKVKYNQQYFSFLSFIYNRFVVCTKNNSQFTINFIISNKLISNNVNNYYLNFNVAGIYLNKADNFIIIFGDLRNVLY